VDDDRRLPWDWSGRSIPEGVRIEEGAYVESAYSFALYRSERSPGVTIARGASVYQGCMFDLTSESEVQIGEYTLLNGVWLLSDRQISIGHHTLISWDVVILDTPQWSHDIRTRRKQTKLVAASSERMPLAPQADPQPVTIGNNVWIGFGAVIMPGVTIGEGSVVGSKSVVFDDIAKYSVAAGNPARHLRSLR
jgi:acetyltransferase-like isoleucine patch superfamily enzyme